MMSVDVDAMGRAIDAVQAILDPITDPYERLGNYAELLGRLEVLAPEAVLQACQAHHAWHS